MENILILIIVVLLFIVGYIFSKYRKVMKKNSIENFQIENETLKKLKNDFEQKEILFSSTLKNLEIEKYSTIKEKNIEVEKIKNEKVELIEKYNEKIFSLKNDFLQEKTKMFNLGVEEGKKSYNYEVQVHPYQKAVKVDKFFGSENLIEIGYKYMMFINNTPSLSHVEIFETLSKKEINEERINSLVTKISDVVNVFPNSNFKLVGNLADFAKNILNTKSVK